MTNQNNKMLSPVKLQQKLKTKKYKDENENKTVRMEIRLTKKEMNDLKREARDSGLSISQFVRNRIMSKPQLNPRIAIDIVHMDEWFNQAAAIKSDCKSAKSVREKAGIENMLEESLNIIDKLSGEFNEIKEKLYESNISKVERCRLKKEKEKIQNSEQVQLPEVV